MDFLAQLFAKKGAISGLDIGVSSIKMAQIKQKKDKTYELSSLIVGATPAMTIEDGRIKDPRALGDSIKQLILSNRLNAQKAVGLLSGQSIVIRPITMAKMGEKDLAQAVKFQAEQYIPYSVSDAQVKGMIMRKELEDDPKMMEVLLIAAPNEMVKNNQDVIRYAGLVPEAIDMEPFALFRGLELCLEPEQMKKTVALINIGASATSINIYKSGMPRTNRAVKVAGNSFTKVISQSLNLSFEEAEKIKKDKGVIRVEKDATPVAPTTMRIFNVIIPVLTELITEVQRSFDFYRSRYGGESVDLVVISGGTARFRNIDVYMENELGIQCKVANPLKSMDLSRVQGFSPETLQELAPSLLPVIGLLMRNI